MTVLGDLAQATGSRVARRAGTRRSCISAGPRTRSPRSSRWATGCRVRSSRSRIGCCRSRRPASHRRGRCAPTATRPTCTRSRRDELVPAVAEHALVLAKEFATVAVIAADDAGRRAARARSRTAASCSPSRARSRPTGRSSCCRPRSRRASSSTRSIVVEPAEIVADRAARRPPAVRRADPGGAAPRARARVAAARALLRASNAGRRTLAAMAGPTPIHITTRSGSVACRGRTPVPSSRSTGGTIDRRRRRRRSRSVATAGASAIAVRCPAGTDVTVGTDRRARSSCTGALGRGPRRDRERQDPRRATRARRRAHEVGHGRHRRRARASAGS